MVAPTAVLIGGFFSLVALYHTYRLMTVLRLYHSLPASASDTAPAIADGEPATVKGTISVNEPAPASERVTDRRESPIAMYVWGAAFESANGRNRIDFGEREIKQSTSTFASGVEYGSFAVRAGGTDVQVDPSWLRDAYDAEKLSNLQPTGVNSSHAWEMYLCESPHVHLNDHHWEMSLERLRDVVDVAGSDLSFDDYLVRSKAVPEGSQLTVHGELSVEGGTPTIEGTDDTPLVVADGGVDGVRRDLRWTALKYVVLVALWTTLVALIVLGELA